VNAKTITLSFKDEKKHSVRYDSPEKDAMISSIYIHKSALTRPWPKQVRVTVEEA
jgi:hypothetical protein